MTTEIFDAERKPFHRRIINCEPNKSSRLAEGERIIPNALNPDTIPGIARKPPTDHDLGKPSAVLKPAYRRSISRTAIKYSGGGRCMHPERTCLQLLVCQNFPLSAPNPFSMKVRQVGCGGVACWKVSFHPAFLAINYVFAPCRQNRPSRSVKRVPTYGGNKRNTGVFCGNETLDDTPILPAAVRRIRPSTYNIAIA